MRSNTVLTQALDALAVEDVGGLSDGELHAQLLALLSAANRLQAQVGRRVLAMDRRGLSPAQPAGPLAGSRSDKLRGCGTSGW